jgi:hypothetical protein
VKARPRRCENRAAEELNKHFVPLGFTPLQRVPVIGRTGPDLTINETKLVVDVKSRISVPISYMVTQQTTLGQLLCIRIRYICNLSGTSLITGKPLKTVEGYYAHMKDWRDRHRPDGITALILHRPGMPFGDAVFIIHQSDIQEFQKIWIKS